MKKTILLTGATGFLGSHLLKRLFNKYNLIILKRSFSDTWRIADYLDKVKFYDIDKVSIDIPFRENKIDYIIHTAVNYGRDGGKISDVLNDNLMFSIKLLESAIFFNTDTFLNTDTLLYSYLNYYTLSKKHFRDYLKFFSNEIKVINLKLEHIYGPYDSSKKFVLWLISNLINNVEELNFTKGEQVRDFIYIEDVVNAYDIVLEKISSINKGFKEFDVGTGNFIKIKDFVIMVRDIIRGAFNIDIRTRLNFGSIPYRENEFFNIKEDLKPLLELGWRTKYSLEEGLFETIKYVIGGKR